jgi:hypothetical protein
MATEIASLRSAFFATDCLFCFATLSFLATDYTDYTDEYNCFIKTYKENDNSLLMIVRWDKILNIRVICVIRGKLYSLRQQRQKNFLRGNLLYIFAPYLWNKRSLSPSMGGHPAEKVR